MQAVRNLLRSLKKHPKLSLPKPQGVGCSVSVKGVGLHALEELIRPFQDILRSLLLETVMRCRAASFLPLGHFSWVVVVVESQSKDPVWLQTVHDPMQPLEKDRVANPVMLESRLRIHQLAGQRGSYSILVVRHSLGSVPLRRATIQRKVGREYPIVESFAWE